MGMKLSCSLSSLPLANSLFTTAIFDMADLQCGKPCQQVLRIWTNWRETQKSEWNISILEIMLHQAKDYLICEQKYTMRVQGNRGFWLWWKPRYKTTLGSLENYVVQFAWGDMLGNLPDGNESGFPLKCIHSLHNLLLLCILLTSCSSL